VYPCIMYDWLTKVEQNICDIEISLINLMIWQLLTNPGYLVLVDMEIATFTVPSFLLFCKLLIFIQGILWWNVLFIWFCFLINFVF
jgi:hypothetical protein